MTSGFRLNNAAIANQNENAPRTGAFSWSLANFQAVFGNLTGGDARPPRASPRLGPKQVAVKVGSTLQPHGCLDATSTQNLGILLFNPRTLALWLANALW